MKHYNLPSYFQQHATQSDSFQLHHYQVNSGAERLKIHLDQNVFSFLTEGVKEIVYGDAQERIDRQKFLLINAGRCLMTEHNSTNELYQSLLLFFSKSQFNQFLEEQEITIPTNLSPQPFLVFEYDNYVRQFVKGLQQLTTAPIALRSKLLPVKFREIMQYLVFQYGVDFLAAIRSNFSDTEQHFSKIIQNNIHNQLSIQELAFLCNMSVSTFKRTFKRHFHQSPSRWFTEKRLQHAAYLLKNQSLRPSDIYLECGYESLSSFIQAFKKQYGVTPKQYLL